MRHYMQKKWIPVAIMVAGILYYLLDPVTQGHWLPHCRVRQLTGYACPGCGAQRALHALLHGRVVEAAGYNLLLAIYTFGLLLYMVSGLHPCLHAVRRLLAHRFTLTLAFCLVPLWWVVRNVLGL